MGQGTRALLLAAVLGSLQLGAGAALAGQPFMQTGGRTTQPVGHYEFCLANMAECQQVTAKRPPIELTRKLWAAMIDVNNSINTSIEPRTDMEIWGKEEVWSYPDKFGDCEDFVLAKRRALMQLGVPAGNLLITVVRQPNGDGHAVLTVETSMGDFILDNLEPRILAWDQTDYTFLKRQSVRNSGTWIAINDDRGTAVASVGGTK